MNAHNPPAADPTMDDDGGLGAQRRMGRGLADQFDLRRLANMFRRRIRLFAAVALVVFVAVVLATLPATPMYTARSRW